MKFISLIKNPKIQRNIVFLVLILVIVFIRRCGPQNSLKSLEQNIAALNDSLRVYRSKNSSLIYQKLALITENGYLKSLNQDLAQEVKKLKDKPFVVIQTRSKILHDTIRVPIYLDESQTSNLDTSSLTQNFFWSLNQDYGNGNYHKLSGNFKIRLDSCDHVSTSDMSLTTDEIGISLTTGLTQRGEMLEIFVTSDYPGFQVTQLQGALIDPQNSKVLKKYLRPKRWSLGIYTGYGLYFDPVQVRIGSGIQLGIGLHYNFLQWNFRK